MQSVKGKTESEIREFNLACIMHTCDAKDALEMPSCDTYDEFMFLLKEFWLLEDTHVFKETNITYRTIYVWNNVYYDVTADIMFHDDYDDCNEVVNMTCEHVSKSDILNNYDLYDIYMILHMIVTMIRIPRMISCTNS